MEIFQKGVETRPILGDVDTFCGSTQNPYALPIQKTGEPYSGLSAESHNHAHGLFHPYDIQNVFRCQRFEIKTV